MKVLITGIKGQLGKSLLSLGNSEFNIVGLDKKDFDLRNFSNCKKVIEELRPDWVINPAAFTAVDLAESRKKDAYEINSKGVENLARSISNVGGKLLHISTDFVFDGEQNIPYKTNDICNPKNVYGKSKLEGEKLALKYPGTTILRTSWLYSPFGKNFCLTMLKLHKKFHADKIPLKIVSDQIGCPTSCKTLANVCWRFLDHKTDKNPLNRIFHWSDNGVASWYDFSIAIGEIGTKYKLLNASAEVIPIKSKDYKTDANRPKFSLLDCTKTVEYLNFQQTYWRNALIEVISCINKKDID